MKLVQRPTLLSADHNIFDFDEGHMIWGENENTGSINQQENTYIKSYLPKLSKEVKTVSPTTVKSNN